MENFASESLATFAAEWWRTIERNIHGLPQKFRPLLQKVYFSHISASLESRADRGNYRYNARLLKKMLKEYDNAAVVTFTNELRERYRQRRALLEELAVIPPQISSDTPGRTFKKL